VRFWKCPDGWLLPGGFAVEWLAAGTYDRSVGLLLFTGQIAHKIDQDVDVERDHIIATVAAAAPSAEVEVIRNFSSGYHCRNGGGDLIETDGDLPVLDLSALPAAGAEVVGPVVPRRARRPGQIVFGALVAALLGLFYLAVEAVVSLPTTDDVMSEAEAVFVIVFFGLIAAVNLGLAVAVLTGRNWARIVLCASSVTSIVSAFLGADLAEHEPGLRRDERAGAAGPVE
jgi:hypothetical protein